MTKRQQALLRGEFPVSDTPILPRPDIEVEFGNGNTAVVRSKQHITQDRALELVQAKRPGNWVFPLNWRVVVDGLEICHANPHLNSDEYWVWLLKKV